MRDKVGDGAKATLILIVLRDDHPESGGHRDAPDLLRGGLGKDWADLHPDRAVALDVTAHDALLEVLPEARVEGVQLRDDIRKQEGFLLGLLAVADRDGVIRRKMATVIPRTHKLGGRHARGGTDVRLKGRRPLEVHVLIREDTVRRPTRGWEAIVVPDAITLIHEVLQAALIGWFAVRRGRVFIRLGRGDDITLHHLGLVGELIERSDDFVGGHPIFTDAIDDVQDVVLDGDFPCAIGQAIDDQQGHEAGADTDRQPTQELQQPTHVSESGSSTAKPSGQAAHR